MEVTIEQEAVASVRTVCPKEQKPHKTVEAAGSSIVVLKTAWAASDHPETSPTVQGTP